MLDVAYSDRDAAKAAGARWYPELGHAYVGRTLPAELHRYRPKPYSWTSWLEQDLRGSVNRTATPPDATTGSFTLREDQEDAVAAIMIARRNGAPDALLADDVGTGKTLMAVAAIKRMPDVARVLVVCPLSVAPAWRYTIAAMGDGGKHWCVINYESAKKLLSVPSAARDAKRQRTKNRRIVDAGTPRVAWDVVITDESHYLANPTSQQSITLDRIISGPNRTRAFALRMSATAGANPVELSYLHRALYWADGRAPMKRLDTDGYAGWCAGRGLAVKANRGGLSWRDNQNDLDTMRDLIFNSSLRWALRRQREDWPEQQRIPVPVELTTAEKVAYEEAWAHFQTAMSEIDRGRREQGPSLTSADRARREAQLRKQGLAAMTRYRQKAGQIRAAHAAAFIADMVKKGQQVGVSCEYLGAVERIRAELDRLNVPTAIFTGQNATLREEERIAFQRGQVPVIIYTPVAGFNLHAGEDAVGGNSVPRVNVIAEPRWSPKKALQAEGRLHRDGHSAPCYYMFAVDTIEERVIQVVTHGMRNIGSIMGDDTTPFDTLAEILGAPDGILR